MQFILCCMPLNFKDMEEFVLDFVEDGSMIPIDIVSEITGLTYEEIRSCSEILVIDQWHTTLNVKSVLMIFK